ncbi:MAG: hypothetical protein ACYC7D_15810 [Nitrososphaerales archaeon]
MPNHVDIILGYMRLLTSLTDSPKYSFEKVRSSDIPSKAGDYLISDTKYSTAVYIGQPKNLNARLLRQHKLGNIIGSNFRRTVALHYLGDGSKESTPELERKITDYIIRNFSFQFVLIHDYVDRIKFEHFATAVLSPVLNLLPQREIKRSHEAIPNSSTSGTG